MNNDPTRLKNTAIRLTCASLNVVGTYPTETLWRRRDHTPAEVVAVDHHTVPLLQLLSRIELFPRPAEDLFAIISNDDPGGGLEISVANASIEEGNSGTKDMTITVTLSARSASDVSMTWFTADDTAISGSDYTAGLSTLVIPAGSISGTISVGINPDTTVEGFESFSVNIAGANQGTIVKPVGVATITDDD